jgi:tRNA threonylcarbamoyladenosine biosynthesis protein TsaB
VKILAIDTSTKTLSVAVAEDDKILASFHDKNELQHSKLLIPTIDRMLREARLELKNINAAALSIGPGSFTGLRIGVATCKAINLALNIPIAEVPTLDVIAYNFISEKERQLCPVIDAKKRKVYASLFNRPRLTAPVELGRLERVTDYMLLDIEELIKRIKELTVVFGDGVVSYREQLKKNPLIRISMKEWFPKAEVVAKLGLVKAEKREFANPDKLVPMYLHSKYCQVRSEVGSRKSEVR